MVTIQADEEGGAGVLLGNAAGNDANHALMPAFVGQDDCLWGCSGGEHGHCLLVNFGFHTLPLAVQLAQLVGNLSSPLRVLGEE